MHPGHEVCTQQPGIWFHIPDLEYGSHPGDVLWNTRNPLVRLRTQRDPDHTPCPLKCRQSLRVNQTALGFSLILAAITTHTGRILWSMTTLLDPHASCLYCVQSLPKWDGGRSFGSLSFKTLITFLRDSTKNSKGEVKSFHSSTAAVTPLNITVSPRQPPAQLFWNARSRPRGGLHKNSDLVHPALLLF